MSERIQASGHEAVSLNTTQLFAASASPAVRLVVNVRSRWSAPYTCATARGSPFGAASQFRPSASSSRISSSGRISRSGIASLIVLSTALMESTARGAAVSVWLLMPTWGAKRETAANGELDLGGLKLDEEP